MKYSYTIKKQDIKKYLQKKHRKVNLFCMIIFILLFILINLNVFMNNQKLMMIILGCTVAVISILIFIINKLYILASMKRMEKDQMTFGKHYVVVDESHIEDTINKHKLSFLWEDIQKIKITEKQIIIKPKNGTVSLVLEKQMMKSADFDHLVREIKKYK